MTTPESRWQRIKTWRERCQDFDDMHITTSGDIKRVMQEEIDELRSALASSPREKA